MTTRYEFIAKGREFLRTRHIHQGRLKNVGVDCVGLVLCVAEELGLRDKVGKPLLAADYPTYPLQPTNALVHEEMQRRAVEKPLSEMKPGDVVTISFPKHPCHVGIITNLSGFPAILHCYATAGGVVEHVLDMKWRRRIAGVFTLPGVVD